MKNLFIGLFILGLTLNGFADFGDPDVRLFAPIRARIYREICEGKIANKGQLEGRFQEFRGRKLKTPIKDVEYNTFVANVLANMYRNEKFLEDFPKEEVIEKLKMHMQKAIEAGSEYALSDAYEMTGKAHLSVCIKAMRLLLTNTIQDCVRLRWACEQSFKGQRYEDVLKDIFDRDIDIPQDYPESDRGIFIPSPEKLEFNNATIDRLTTFLNDKCQTDPFYEVIKFSLESWRKQCKN